MERKSYMNLLSVFWEDLFSYRLIASHYMLTMGSSTALGCRIPRKWGLLVTPKPSFRKGSCGKNKLISKWLFTSKIIAAPIQSP